MHIDFVLPVKGDIMAGLEAWTQRAAAGCMDYAFHVAVTAWNSKVEADMAAAVAKGVNSFKFFLAYKVCGCTCGAGRAPDVDLSMRQRIGRIASD
jgi:dihydropyrimidinase